jgi:hypothetical protein
MYAKLFALSRIHVARTLFKYTGLFLRLPGTDHSNITGATNASLDSDW